MTQSTLGFKTCKILTQLLTLIGIILNIICFGVNLYYYKLLKVESSLMQPYFITHCELGLLVLGGNLVILIFCNCGVTSYNKVIMKMYKKTAIVYSFIIVCLVTYFLTLYIVEFNSRAGEAVYAGTQDGGFIMAMYSGNTNAVAVKNVTSQFKYILTTTCICDVLCIGINILSILLIKIIINIKLEVKEEPKPKIKEIEHAGMSTTSLKRR